MIGKNIKALHKRSLYLAVNGEMILQLIEQISPQNLTLAQKPLESVT